MGFSLAGVTEAYEVENQQDAERTVNKLLQRSDIGIIGVASSIVADVKDRRLKETMASSLLPMVVVLPEYGEQVAEDPLRKLIIRVLGVDLQASMK